ncbi:hypothetical protein DL95DRAFT_407569 [Leptodontidium sp. 2 PMI_412]|nr:hypothetical protein DL95DRAFT_407569 [Leptodontidium sp. 2 PMI_412]
MARSRHVLPRRPLDRLPFSPSVEELRHNRGFDDTIKLSAEYLFSLDRNAAEPDSDSAPIAESESELTPSASSPASQDPVAAPVSSSTFASASAAPVSSSTPTSTNATSYQPTHRYSTGPTHLLQHYLAQPEFIHPAPKDDPHEHQDTDKLYGIYSK